MGDNAVVRGKLELERTTCLSSRLKDTNYLTDAEYLTRAKQVRITVFQEVGALCDNGQITGL